ncbi:olfactomedin-like protein 3 [Alosa pseudoharengus]|uniref:olfactomedin-like protein 3 n=1 Tax=Alosa pseudoharengus TaxID=34774 RepID=UPI003F8C4AD7
MYIRLLHLATLLLLASNSSHAQRITSDLAMMQYFQARLIQLEERLIKCDQNIQVYGQKIYDLTNEMHGQVNRIRAHKSEVRVQVENVALRVGRLERDMEYVQTRIPNEPQVDMEEALLDQQLKEARKLREKAKVNIGTDCGTVLTGVKSMKTVKKTGDVYGAWLRDLTEGSAKVYYFDGTKNDTMLEYTSVKTFRESNSNQNANTIKLPFPWQGTGHIVYDGFVYYHQADTTNRIVKVHLLNRTVSDSILLPGVGHLPAYALSPHTFVHLVVDEIGLWSIYADPDLGGNLVITKLDLGTMHVEHSWDTPCKSQDAEAAFLICGTMYVVYNTRHGGRSSIRCLHDIHDTILNAESPLLFFPKGYTSHASMQYYPKDKQLFSWDDGYQTIYKLDVKKKNMAI